MKPPRSVSISTSTFIKAALIVLGIWFLWYVRDVVAILIASILLTALIDPFADWFARRRIPRGIAVLIVYTILLSVSAVILILLIPVVAEQSVQLIGNVSEHYSDASDSYGQLLQFSERHGFRENIAASVQGLQDSIGSTINSLFTTVKGFFGGLAALMIVLVLTYYMVVEEEKVRLYFQNLAPPEYQPYIAHLTKKMKLKIGSWLRAQLILGLVVGVLVYIGLKLLGVNYALLLALMAGVFEIIPYLGPILALIPAVLIAFVQSPLLAVIVLILYLVIQQLENNLLVPKIMQKVTGLNPIISILALLIGIKVAGLAGAILSIPLATMGVVVLEDLFKDVA